jgi:hypothetical protein
MNEKILIPVCIMIVLQFAYDLFGISFNVKWSIIYFSSQYLSWLVLIFLGIKWIKPIKYAFNKNLPFISLAVGLIIYIILEFRCWYWTWDDYYEYINEFKKFILPIAAIITGLTYYLLKK